jgi:hypothetical protein
VARAPSTSSIIFGHKFPQQFAGRAHASHKRRFSISSSTTRFRKLEFSASRAFKAVIMFFRTPPIGHRARSHGNTGYRHHPPRAITHQYLRTRIFSESYFLLSQRRRYSWAAGIGWLKCHSHTRAARRTGADPLECGQTKGDREQRYAKAALSHRPSPQDVQDVERSMSPWRVLE